MIYDMKLHVEPFMLMQAGKKTIELRLYDEKRKQLKAGDIIRFTRVDNSQLFFCALIIRIYHFKDFEELYNNLPLLKCGYTEENVSEASSTDMNKYYTREEQERHGVVGIEVQTLNDDLKREMESGHDLCCWNTRCR